MSGKKKKQATYQEVGEKIAEGGADIAVSKLTHDETRRATALSLACRYYVETIVKDGDLYREMVRDNKVLKPATYMGVIEVAFNFEAYLSGELKKNVAAIAQETAIIQKAREEMEAEIEQPEPTHAE